MSLVGPRPELPELVEKYQPWQRERFAIPQGLTGWWQIHGRSDRPMHLHTEDDLYYVQNYSFWLDHPDPDPNLLDRSARQGSLLMLRFLRIHQLKLILALGLLHGLLYVFLVPPWQHYDEPTHFEYAWLLANRSGLPKPGDYDQNMRRAVAVSMVEHNFFRGMNFLPDLNVQNEPIWIGLFPIR